MASFFLLVPQNPCHRPGPTGAGEIEVGNGGGHTTTLVGNLGEKEYLWVRLHVPRLSCWAITAPR